MNRSENIPFRVHIYLRLRRIVILFNDIAHKYGPKRGICSRFTYYQTVSLYWGRIILLFICLIYSSLATAEQSISKILELSSAQLQFYEQNNFKILGAVQLNRDADPDHPLMEFSGLAWDHDQNDLIILSDRGFIIHVNPIFKKDKLVNVELLSYHRLKDADGKKLVHKAADSEGLALKNAKNNINGDTELIISFERQARVAHYTTDGKFISNNSINNALNDITNYAGSNKALEAITLHNQFNIITGPERPLDSSTNNLLSLHTLNDKEWIFTPDNENYGSLVGLTTLPDDRLIALERIFPGVFAGVSNVVHLITLEANSLKQETLLKLKPSDGYFNDNFEGISWHKNNRFFMISDDNDNLLQRTILIYFEIPDLGKI
jgi:hypothetical protein